jgi:hypothetical protein
LIQAELKDPTTKARMAEAWKELTQTLTQELREIELLATIAAKFEMKPCP